MDLPGGQKTSELPHLSDLSFTPQTCFIPYSESLFCTSQTTAPLFPPILHHCTVLGKGYACVRLKYLLPQLLLPQKFVTQSVNESCGHLFRPSIKFSCF